MLLATAGSSPVAKTPAYVSESVVVSIQRPHWKATPTQSGQSVFFQAPRAPSSARKAQILVVRTAYFLSLAPQMAPSRFGPSVLHPSLSPHRQAHQGVEWAEVDAIPSLLAATTRARPSPTLLRALRSTTHWCTASSAHLRRAPLQQVYLRSGPRARLLSFPTLIPAF